MKRSSIDESGGENLLLPGMYFGANALYSIGKHEESIADRSAYAVKSGTKLLTISARDFKRIVGQDWIKRTTRKLMEEAEGKELKEGTDTRSRNLSGTTMKTNSKKGWLSGMKKKVTKSSSKPNLKKSASRRSIAKHSVSQWPLPLQMR